MSASLKNMPNFVTDAYRITPQNAFKPENIVIGSYTFLAWVRGGVGAVVNTPAAGLRATVDVAVPVQADGQADLQAGTTVHVRGPGDVLGLDERQIIRRYPLPEATDAEDTFLAHVEFDRPVIPWLFSPTAAAGDRLVPWIVLVVLEQGRYQLRPGSQGRPDQVATFLGELQPTDDAWAWAHAQLIGTPDTVPDPADQPDDRLTAEYGQANLSRLLCPRKLDTQRQYLACVVPLYNAGVAAGLGEPPPANLAMAWTRAADGSDTDTAITLPLYTSWRFATGADGDFASLAEKLHGVAAPWQIGRRLTETSTPGGGLPPLADGDPGQLQTIHGPVYSPNAPDPKSPDPTEVAAVTAETASWPATETEALRAELDRPYELARRTASPDDPVPRPVVGPEIYARYQAAAARVEPSRDADWFGQLNLRPEHRVAAGLGTRVVQMDQEQLMQSAWAQVGEIDAANRSLRWVQLARFVGTASYERHITPLAFGDLLAATRRVQSRVLAQPALTVAADVAESNLADAAVSSAFRRVTRPLGGLARFVAADPSGQGRLVAEDGTARDMQRPYQELDGVAGVSSAAAAALDPQRVAPALGVDVSGVPGRPRGGWHRPGRPAGAHRHHGRARPPHRPRPRGLCGVRRQATAEPPTAGTEAAAGQEPGLVGQRSRPGTGNAGDPRAGRCRARDSCGAHEGHRREATAPAGAGRHPPERPRSDPGLVAPGLHGDRRRSGRARLAGYRASARARHHLTVPGRACRPGGEPDRARQSTLRRQPARRGCPQTGSMTCC